MSFLPEIPSRCARFRAIFEEEQDLPPCLQDE